MCKRTTFERVMFMWISEARKCKLTCVSKETGDQLESKGNVVDGTRCSYSSPHDLCIRGKCHVSIQACDRCGLPAPCGSSTSPASVRHCEPMSLTQ